MTDHICTLHRAEALDAAAEGVVSFAHGRESSVRALSPGDRVIVYAPLTRTGGDRLQAFVAHATVTGDHPEPRDFGARGIGWVRRATYDRVSEVPVRPMIDALDILRDRRNWGGVFRAGKVRISAADHDRIAVAMGLSP